MSLVASSIAGASYALGNAEERDSGTGFEVGQVADRRVDHPFSWDRANVGLSDDGLWFHLTRPTVHQAETMAPASTTRARGIRSVLRETHAGAER
jgi:hypothetical protein